MMRKEFIRNDICFTHVAQCCRYAFSTLSTVSKDQVGIATAEPENIRADELLSRDLELFSFFGHPLKITFNLNL